MQKALFLDRDGTIILDKHYLDNPEEVELTPGAVEFLEVALKQNYLLFLFTNQSGINRGYFTLDTVERCNHKMLELLGLGGDIFTDTCIAPETPEEDPVYRKPSPKFIQEMTHRHGLDPKHSFMIGDSVKDLQSGINAGIGAAWVGTGKEATTELEAYIQAHDCLQAPTLGELGTLIFEQ